MTAEDVHGHQATQRIATVRFAGQDWTLRPGATLTFGRGRECHIRLTDDQHLSRRAGSLVGHQDYVVIRNDSGSKPVVVRPPTGEDRLVEPGAATTSLPLNRFDVVVFGLGGQIVALHVTTNPPMPPNPGPPLSAPGTAERERIGTVTSPFTLSAAQRRILLALCEPMLTRNGQAARPATYAQIARRLSLRPGYVRNVVQALRETLTGYGLAALTEEASQSVAEDFRRELAQWAVRSGWVQVHHLAELDGKGEETRPRHPPTPGGRR